MNDTTTLIELLVTLKEKVERMEGMLCKLTDNARYMNIPQAAKHYRISEERLRAMCINNIIEGCYFLLNNNNNKKHYMIDTHKLDELLDQGGIISFQVRKYQRK